MRAYRISTANPNVTKRTMTVDDQETPLAHEILTHLREGIVRGFPRRCKLELFTAAETTLHAELIHFLTTD